MFKKPPVSVRTGRGLFVLVDKVAVVEGRSAFPVYASAYAPQGGIDCPLRNKSYDPLRVDRKKERNVFCLLRGDIQWVVSKKRMT